MFNKYNKNTTELYRQLKILKSISQHSVIDIKICDKNHLTKKQKYSFTFHKSN